MATKGKTFPLDSGITITWTTPPLFGGQQEVVATITGDELAEVLAWLALEHGPKPDLSNNSILGCTIVGLGEAVRALGLGANHFGENMVDLAEVCDALGEVIRPGPPACRARGAPAGRGNDHGAVRGAGRRGCVMATRKKSPEIPPITDEAVARAEAAHGLDPASIALSKAGAALVLLDHIHAGALSLTLPTYLQPDTPSTDDVLDWLEGMAIEKLAEALQEAREAVNKMHARMGVA